MKKILLLLIVFIFNFIPSLANNEVYLQVNRRETLRVPAQKEVFSYESDSEESYFEDLNTNDEIFESKFGKAFSSLIEKTMINNKVNDRINHFTDN